MKRTALVVLGMHESGPAMLGWALHRLGAGLPQDLLPSQSVPHDAIWGSAKLARLNESILQACDEDGSNAASVAGDALEAHSRGMLGKQAAAFLQCHCGEAPTYVLHDARLTRLLPFWLPVLRQADHDVRFIVVARRPHAVADLLAHTRSLDPESVYLMWLGHLLDAERETRGAARVFVTYEACVDDVRACISHITTSLGLQWEIPCEAVDPGAQIAAQRPMGSPCDAVAQKGGQHLIERWASDAYNLIVRGDSHVLPAFFGALRPDFDAVARLPRSSQRRCRALFNADLRRLSQAHEVALCQLRQERDEALANLQERHALISKLHKSWRSRRLLPRFRRALQSRLSP